MLKFKNFLLLLFHGFGLVFGVYSLGETLNIHKNVDIQKLVFHLRETETFKNITAEKVEKHFRENKYVGLLFFTLWNFGLQIAFLLLAIADETCKLVSRSATQKRLEKARQFFFSTLVFPSSLLVMTIFWSIWHIDRELIFPKAIDKFYPTWLNHTLHTLIIIPLLVEILFQSSNKNYTVSRTQASLVILTYSTFYKILYLSVYFQHGIWLYPVYKVLSWTQRIAFILLQFGLLLGYQQVGISLLSRGKAIKSEKKVI